MFKIIVNNNGTNLNMTLCMVWIGVVGGGVCHHLYEYVIVTESRGFEVICR